MRFTYFARAANPGTRILFDEWLEHRLDDECCRSILVTLPFFDAPGQERLPSLKRPSAAFGRRSRER